MSWWSAKWRTEPFKEDQSTENSKLSFWIEYIKNILSILKKFKTCQRFKFSKVNVLEQADKLKKKKKSNENWILYMKEFQGNLRLSGWTANINTQSLI